MLSNELFVSFFFEFICRALTESEQFSYSCKNQSTDNYHLWQFVNTLFEKVTLDKLCQYLASNKMTHKYRLVWIVLNDSLPICDGFVLLLACDASRFENFSYIEKIDSIEWKRVTVNLRWLSASIYCVMYYFGRKKFMKWIRQF